MEDWTKVLLYGTFDGFNRSTDGLSQINVILDGGEKVEIPKQFVVSADQMVNKNKIKLKDVIARIEKFDLGTKAVWINEILYKLGSDYGMHKYYVGYNQGKLEGAMEREEVTIPQIVANYIEYTKVNEWDLLEAMDDVAYEDNDELRKWFNKNMETFALAWINGYTVKEEKRYRVKIIGIKDYDSYLNYRKKEKVWTIESKMEVDAIKTSHTRKELEEAGFGWVFDCEGIEVEEVE